MKTIGITGLLGLLFVALKLTGKITWSWWIVTIPFYWGFAAVIGMVAIGWPLYWLMGKPINPMSNRRK